MNEEEILAGHKKCSTCKSIKKLSEYHRRKSIKSGYRSQCKSCISGKRSLHYQANRERILKKNNKYSRENKERRAIYHKQYSKDNREALSGYQKQHYRQNKDHILNQHSQYKRDKRKNDPVYRLRENLSSQIWRALNDQNLSKTKSCMEYVDYTAKQLYEHLELQGYSLIEAPHVDHIIPQSLYDFTDENEISKCWDLRNLRPLDASENMSKHNTLDMDLVRLYGIEDLMPSIKTP